MIDLAGVSGYNGIEVICLLGMVLCFLSYKKKGGGGTADGYGTKKCGQCNRTGRTI